ncbi:hypothetical protein [Streptomyces sp. NPDC002758]
MSPAEAVRVIEDIVRVPREEMTREALLSALDVLRAAHAVTSELTFRGRRR